MDKSTQKNTPNSEMAPTHTPLKEEDSKITSVHNPRLYVQKTYQQLFSPQETQPHTNKPKREKVAHQIEGQTQRLNQGQQSNKARKPKISRTTRKGEPNVISSNYTSTDSEKRTKK